MIMANAHFERLTAEKKVFSKTCSSTVEKFKWLGNYGQWGVPGWSMNEDATEIILRLAASFSGKEVLELGTARGRLTAMLATLGCNITTVDHHDRGAAKNLAGLSMNVVVDDIVHFLTTSNQYFDLIICDVHGNSPRDWINYSKPLRRSVKKGSTLIINNYFLDKIPEWREETGVEWFLKQLPRQWSFTLYNAIIPGIAVVANQHLYRHFSDWFF